MLDVLEFILHYGGHFLVPVLFFYYFVPQKWKLYSVVFLSAMAIDLDHLWADPLFDPNRCSVGFHFLHSPWAVAGYVLLSLVPITRIIGLALLWHVLVDATNCAWLLV